MARVPVIATGPAFVPGCRSSPAHFFILVGDGDLPDFRAASPPALVARLGWLSCFCSPTTCTGWLRLIVHPVGHRGQFVVQIWFGFAALVGAAPRVPRPEVGCRSFSSALSLVLTMPFVPSVQPLCCSGPAVQLAVDSPPTYLLAGGYPAALGRRGLTLDIVVLLHLFILVCALSVSFRCFAPVTFLADAQLFGGGPALLHVACAVRFYIRGGLLFLCLQAPLGSIFSTFACASCAADGGGFRPLGC